ncbi:hypothetical protein [Candidatus Sororendozoicomonas aggregata]|uniref:hypothetical protein n=1 Tax=Candidatus Sororendozoicomonas aggregata TaxID=3073239 RepID=UPI002ED2646A
MNRLLSAISIFIYMMFFTNVSFADYDLQDTLQVNFVNTTDYDCTTSVDLKHGRWDTKPPEVIPKRVSTFWIASQQNLRGPDMTITFTCGDYSFSVRNQQNFCLFKGGEQTNTTSDVDEHLNVINKQIKKASYHDKTPGIAQIIVLSKG